MNIRVGGFQVARVLDEGLHLLSYQSHGRVLGVCGQVRLKVAPAPDMIGLCRALHPRGLAGRRGAATRGVWQSRPRLEAVQCSVLWWPRHFRYIANPLNFGPRAGVDRGDTYLVLALLLDSIPRRRSLS